MFRNSSTPECECEEGFIEINYNECRFPCDGVTCYDMTPEVILDPTTPPAVYKYTIEVAVFDFYSDAERLFLSCNDNGVLKRKILNKIKKK
jgi:hypothetical protein